MKYALVVIDVQTLLVTEQLYQKDLLIRNIKRLLAFCRDHGIEIIYVQHCDDPGDELEKGKPGWEIYHEVAPIKQERVFEKTRNSMFKDTGLKEYLQQSEITEIVLVGLQTEYCVDASCKAALEHGFHTIIPADCTSTCDNGEWSAKQLTEFYTERIWKNRFAQILSVDEVEDLLTKQV